MKNHWELLKILKFKIQDCINKLQENNPSSRATLEEESSTCFPSLYDFDQNE